MKIYVVGAGVGDKCYLTAYGHDTIKNSEVVLTTKRLFDKLSSLNNNCIGLEITEFVPFINQNKNLYSSICVLASGDIGFFSIAKTLKEKISDCEIEFISGISSLQYLTAKLGTTYEDIKVVSVHGRENIVIPFVCYNKKVFILTGGKCKANDVIQELVSVGLGNVLVSVGSFLSDDNEIIITNTAEKLKDMIFDNLTVMLIQNNNFIESNKKIYDDEFIRGKTPMTKEAIRTLCISYLDIKVSDIIVDIGSGTGSVTIEMARRASESIVYAFEKDMVAMGLIKENIEKFGAYNIKLINEIAPNGLDKLQNINKAFIGGSSGNLKDIVSILIIQNAVLKIVITAITLETLNEAVQVLDEHNFCTKISCINVANSEKISHYNMMKAENPIYIIVGEKQDENS